MSFILALLTMKRYGKESSEILICLREKPEAILSSPLVNQSLKKKKKKKEYYLFNFDLKLLHIHTSYISIYIAIKKYEYILYFYFIIQLSNLINIFFIFLWEIIKRDLEWMWCVSERCGVYIDVIWRHKFFNIFLIQLYK